MRKNYTSKEKSKLALEVQKGEKSLLELSQEYNVPKTNLSQWHSKLIEGAPLVFEGNEDSLKNIKLLKKHIENLEQSLGKKTMENDWLKKKLEG